MVNGNFFFPIGDDGLLNSYSLAFPMKMLNAQKNNAFPFLFFFVKIFYIACYYLKKESPLSFQDVWLLNF